MIEPEDGGEIYPPPIPTMSPIGAKLAEARRQVRNLLLAEDWAYLAGDPDRVIAEVTDIYDREAVGELESEVRRQAKLIDRLQNEHQIGRLLHMVRELSGFVGHTCRTTTLIGQDACPGCMIEYILADFGLKPVWRSQA